MRTTPRPFDSTSYARGSDSVFPLERRSLRQHDLDGTHVRRAAILGGHLLRRDADISHLGIGDEAPADDLGARPLRHVHLAAPVEFLETVLTRGSFPTRCRRVGAWRMMQLGRSSASLRRSIVVRGRETALASRHGTSIRFGWRPSPRGRKSKTPWSA